MTGHSAAPQPDNSKWQIFFGTHPDPVVILGPQDRFIWKNTAFIRWQEKHHQAVDVVRELMAGENAQQKIHSALRQKQSLRFWLNYFDKTVEITVTPLTETRDEAVAVLYFKLWEAPNLSLVSGDWSVYLDLMQNPFIGVWRIGFPSAIDLSLPGRELAELMFETGIFVECNETMAKMYGFPNLKAMLGKPVKILYPCREPVIQRLMAMIENGLRSELVDSVEIDQFGKTKSFRNAYYGDVVDGRVNWVSGIQLDITERHHSQLRLEVLYRIAHGVLQSHDLSSLYGTIRDELSRVIDTTNFYIVTVDGESDRLEMAVNFDTQGHVNPPTERSLVARVVKQAKTMMLHKGEIKQLIAEGTVDVEDPLPTSWLGVPLKLDKRITGALVVQSYDELLYEEDDLKVLQFVSDQVALAIDRKQTEETFTTNRKKLEALVQNVPEAIYTALDREGNTTFITRKWEKWTGVNAQLIMANPETWHEALHDEDRQAVVQAYERAWDEGEDYFLDYRVVHRDTGEVTYLRDRGIRVENGSEVHYDGIISNVTDFRLTEARLRASVKEKELLLKEVHHRVKNNLQIVMSLLSLQAGKSASHTVKRELQDSRNRVRSMAMIHEKLYNTKHLTHIDLKNYIDSLCKQLYNAYALTKHHVKLVLDIENIPLSMDFAVPFGLIVNELVSNALKYAFPGHWEKEKFITIRLWKENNDQINLFVSDTGIGFDSTFEEVSSHSLGLHLVHILVEDQLDGTLFVDGSHGSQFEMTFPLKEEMMITPMVETAL